MIREIMHLLMVEENKKRNQDGEEPLGELPKPCDYFDLIGGTSTGGYASIYIRNHDYITDILHLIRILQDRCFDAWASSNGCEHSNRVLR